MVEAAATSFADLLKQHRAAAGLTQEELAERAGLSARAISDLERGGKQHPYPHRVQRLVQALGLGEGEAGRFRRAARRSERAHEARAGPAAPARKSLSLPLQPTPFVGRRQEIEEVRTLLGREGVRLLTLTGPGGVGKTRLVLQVAQDIAARYSHGVVFVSLAPLADPGLVASTIAASLKITEGTEQPTLERLTEHLREKQMLLILDNFEHLLPAAEAISRLLAACPQLAIVATSRAILHLAAEHEYPVPPLPVPTPQHLPEPHALSRYDADQLFVQRAQAIKPCFQLTEENSEHQ